MLKLTASTPRFPLCRKTSGREKPATFLSVFYLWQLGHSSASPFCLNLVTSWWLCPLAPPPQAVVAVTLPSEFLSVTASCWQLPALLSAVLLLSLAVVSSGRKLLVVLATLAVSDVSVPSPTTIFGRVSQRRKKKLHSVLSSSWAVIYFWQLSSLWSNLESKHHWISCTVTAS